MKSFNFLPNMAVVLVTSLIVFRSYMRRLTQEFNMAYCALQSVLVTASVDRPDLARELGRQRLLFYRGLMGVEIRLTLNFGAWEN